MQLSNPPLEKEPGQVGSTSQDDQSKEGIQGVETKSKRGVTKCRAEWRDPGHECKTMTTEGYLNIKKRSWHLACAWKEDPIGDQVPSKCRERARIWGRDVNEIERSRPFSTNRHGYLRASSHEMWLCGARMWGSLCIKAQHLGRQGHPSPERLSPPPGPGVTGQESSDST